MKNSMKNIVWLLLAGALVTSLTACRVTPYGNRCGPRYGPCAQPCAPAPAAQIVRVVRSVRPEGWNTEDALAAEKIEILMDEQGAFKEVEYHIKPEDVPQPIRDKMNELFPGGEFSGAEKEMEGGVPYFELSKDIDGLEIEAMFTEGVELHSVERQIPEGDVPPAVKTAIADKFPNGTVTAWEEILDGTQTLVEYHVKLTEDDKNYKVVVTPGGTIERTVREVPTELEVPVQR